MYNTDLPTRAELPSTGKLLRSTITAALVAAGLLVTTILPAEYGIDPIGVGRVLGLTGMGEIKVALAAEAQAGEVSPAVAPVSVAPAQVAMAEPAVAPAVTVAPQVAAVAAPAAAQEAKPAREHSVTITLKPGEAAEVKLSMKKDASVLYEWSAEGGGVNYDTHGDPVNAPKGYYHGYGKGRNETSQTGTLQAAFDGKHGWFWRNRSGDTLTVTLKTRGDYGQIERVL